MIRHPNYVAKHNLPWLCIPSRKVALLHLYIVGDEIGIQRASTGLLFVGFSLHDLVSLSQSSRFGFFHALISPSTPPRVPVREGCHVRSSLLAQLWLVLLVNKAARLFRRVIILQLCEPGEQCGFVFNQPWRQVWVDIAQEVMDKLPARKTNLREPIVFES